MGIHQLYKLIKKQCPSAIQDKKLTDYKNQKIAIDISQWIYQLCCGFKNASSKVKLDPLDDNSDDEPAVTRDPDLLNDNMYLYGLLCRINKILENKILPVFVYDGKTPALKRKTVDKRNLKSAEIKKKISETKDEKEKIKLEAQSFRPSQEQIKCSQKLLDLLGIPYVLAPEEAESQCVKLLQDGLVDNIGTEDSDIFAFGGKKFIRNFPNGKLKEHNLDILLEKLELKSDEFVDLCILLGSDYCSTIGGIGLVRSLEKIKRYRSIEKILEITKKKNVPDDFYYVETRESFKNPVIVVITQEFKLKPAKIEEAREFLNQLNSDRINSALNKFKKNVIKLS